MVLTEKAFKAVKYIAYGLEAAFLVVFIILCIAVSHKNKVIGEYREALRYQCEITDSLNRTVNDLWGQECVRVETSCIINNKGLVNLNQTNQISKSIATYTRGEMVMALDSVRRANNVKE